MRSQAAQKLQIKLKKALVEIKKEIKQEQKFSVVHHVTNHLRIQGTIKCIKEFILERNPTIVPCAKCHFPHQQFLKIISKQRQTDTQRQSSNQHSYNKTKQINNLRNF